MTAEPVGAWRHNIKQSIIIVTVAYKLKDSLLLAVLLKNNHLASTLHDVDICSKVFKLFKILQQTS